MHRCQIVFIAPTERIPARYAFRLSVAGTLLLCEQRHADSHKSWMDTEYAGARSNVILKNREQRTLQFILSLASNLTLADIKFPTCVTTSSTSLAHRNKSVEAPPQTQRSRETHVAGKRERQEDTKDADRVLVTGSELR